MHNDHPDLVKDQYWDEIFPKNIPYETADVVPEEPPKHSTADLDKQSEKKITFLVSHFHVCYTCRVFMNIFFIRKQSSVSQFFTRGNTGSYNENLTEIDTDPQLSLEEPAVLENTLLQPSESNGGNKIEEDDEFEKLKKQRQQDRISRQLPIITIKDKTDDNEETSDGSKDSKRKTSLTSSHTSQESKKFN